MTLGGIGISSIPKLQVVEDIELGSGTGCIYLSGFIGEESKMRVSFKFPLSSMGYSKTICQHLLKKGLLTYSVARISEV